ncbi:NAD-dependent protein deacetylase of SIR2 family [hydrothermal vent metagenome]|uniref:NAD-dependent protein deacetylase of SIR2 family n=1 Tax=hydrothermal vent metagenome TaxID=652676 RepID=A0A3B1CDA8_9ZZZZ
MKIPGDLLDTIVNSKNVAALTGAGVSAESGVPTFRGEEGLWRNFRAEGFTTPEELATPEAFRRDPKLVWEWYDWRRTLIAPLKPNPGHLSLAKFEKRLKKKEEGRFTLVTQNVDGLHRLAGSADPVEMHGNIWFTRCVDEGTVRENRDAPLPQLPPLCPDCGAMVRPHIVWFGESLEPSVLERAYKAAQEAEVFFIIGTSAVVQPSASLAGIAKDAGAMVVEINLESTPVTSLVDLSLKGPSGVILPELLKMIESA